MLVLISLLRGINVGGNKKIRMADLKDLYESLGFTKVKTLLQSGNVVFESQTHDSDKLTGQIETAIEEHFGFQVRIIMRTGADLKAIIERNPFSDKALAEPSKLLVVFLLEELDASKLDAAMEAYEGPEQLHLKGRELYIFYPEGMGRSKLDRTLGKVKMVNTGRNWNTVNKLLAIIEQM